MKRSLIAFALLFAACESPVAPTAPTRSLVGAWDGPGVTLNIEHDDGLTFDGRITGLAATGHVNGRWASPTTDGYIGAEFALSGPGCKVLVAAKGRVTGDTVTWVSPNNCGIAAHVELSRR